MKAKITILLIGLVCALCVTSCSPSDTKKSASSYNDTGFAMGTVINQTLYSDNKELASQIINLLKTTEEKYISWRFEDSDIGIINSGAKGQAPIEISKETASYIKKALKIASDSNGAFDPTIGRLSRLWDFDNNPTDTPADEEISKNMASVGYQNILLDNTKVSIKNESSIDLGAMGKGIGCDEILSLLEESSVSGYLANIGGSSILTYGEKDDGKPWKVAVLNPRDEENYLGSISLKGTNHVSTSGDYERYFEKNGKRYHHILDPKTGYPADSGLISVTVVAKNGSDCDALSTACFVLGRKKAEKLLSKYNAEGIFVDNTKNVYITKGLKDKFELIADEDYILN